MGFEINCFVNPSLVNEDLICNICGGVLEDGLWSPECEHSFCKVCIHKWLQRSTVCPNDRQYLSLTLLKPIPRFMRNILDKLEMKCKFNGNGCLQVIHLESLRQHIPVCDFNPDKQMDCVSGCGLTLKKRELESHNCVKALRQRVDTLVEENMKYERSVTSVRYELNSLRNENKKTNELVNSLQNDVKRLLADRQMSVSTDSNASAVPQSSLGVKSEKNSRMVPNPYVLITPLQSSLGTTDEPSSSTLITSATRFNEEPPYKRRTAIRLATPLSTSGSMTTTISSTLLRSYSPTYSNTNDDTFFRRTPSPMYAIPNITTISPSSETVSQDEESTTAVTLSDSPNTSYFMNLDPNSSFADTEETDPDGDNDR